MIKEEKIDIKCCVFIFRFCLLFMWLFEISDYKMDNMFRYKRSLIVLLSGFNEYLDLIKFSVSIFELVLKIFFGDCKKSMILSLWFWGLGFGGFMFGVSSVRRFSWRMLIRVLIKREDM